ncbi:MAG: ParB/RepB/Spo0J family partition protein [Clostridia bacterium]|nr:ParB/RepB/Spo0J family partition protein [Clostridia bacterium]
MNKEDKRTIKELNLTELRAFTGHPYKVRDDEEMDALIDSIRENGIMVPLTVRRIDNGYEIISGHRRVHAAKLAGLETFPAVEVEMSRDEAAVALVDSNLHREHILPSEKAFAYKLKLEALSRQGKRFDETSRQLVGRLESADLVSDTESGRQVQRYIRLTNLIPPLLEMVDEGRIAFTPAVELSYLSVEEQNLLLFEIGIADATPSLSQAVRLKKLSGEGKLDEETISAIMAEEKPNQRERISIPLERIGRFIPDSAQERAVDFIVKACEFYREHLSRQRDER